MSVSCPRFQYIVADWQQHFAAILTLLNDGKLPTHTEIEHFLSAGGIASTPSPIDRPANKPCCTGDAHAHFDGISEVSAYRRAGGTIVPIFDRLFEMSATQDEKCGQDTFHWDDRYRTEYPALPRCRNDSEYGFVRKMLSV